MTGHDQVAQPEAGMTLIEMVISIALLGLIVGPLTGMIVLGFLSHDGTRDKIADSTSAQLLSRYLVTDIQSATVVQPSTAACGAIGTPLLHLHWNDPKDGPIDVAYTSVATGGHVEVRRQACGADPADPALVVHYLDGNVFGVSCTPACGLHPQEVTVTVTAESDDPQSEAYYQPFSFELTANPRAMATS